MPSIRAIRTRLSIHHPTSTILPTYTRWFIIYFATLVFKGFNVFYLLSPQDSVSCVYASCYATYNHDYLTESSSLLDLKLRSYNYPGSLISVAQVGYQSKAFMRNYPYTRSSSLTQPTSCLISTLTDPACAAAYYNSGCSHSSLPFPTYDARCRLWYEMAVQGGDTSSVYFQSPRKSSAGQYIVTVASPIKNTNTGLIAGVVNFNVLMSRLSDLLNNVPLLNSGYSYLIDVTNSSIILHPRASTQCSTLLCVEGEIGCMYLL